MCVEQQWIIERVEALAALGQHNSADCGWFAGWALKLLHQHGARGVTGTNIRTSRLEVYRARERFLGTTQQVLTHRHDNDLILGNAHTYLTDQSRGLGLSAQYLSRSIAPLQVNPPPDKFQVMATNYLNRRGNFGLMYGFIDSGTAGHWMAVLGGSPTQQPTQLLVYDSSGIGTDSQILGWKNASEFNQHYGGTSPQAIVAAAGPTL